MSVRRFRSHACLIVSILKNNRKTRVKAILLLRVFLFLILFMTTDRIMTERKYWLRHFTD